jgi:hypothetical protein
MPIDKLELNHKYKLEANEKLSKDSILYIDFNNKIVIPYKIEGVNYDTDYDGPNPWIWFYGDGIDRDDRNPLMSFTEYFTITEVISEKYKSRLDLIELE